MIQAVKFCQVGITTVFLLFDKFYSPIDIINYGKLLRLVSSFWVSGTEEIFVDNYRSVISDSWWYICATKIERNNDNNPTLGKQEVHISFTFKWHYYINKNWKSFLILIEILYNCYEI